MSEIKKKYTLQGYSEALSDVSEIIKEIKKCSIYNTYADIALNRLEISLHKKILDKVGKL